MCGIFGIKSINNGPINGLSQKLKVADLIRHRGPDAEGEWQSAANSVGFAHKRLSIIDLSADAAQPMCSQSGNVITFNGEIYNYREIRNSLKDNYRFQSHSDTETILAAYEKYGIDCLSHLKGMFAFSLWDEKKQRLFCARDRFGIKPFYYTVVKGEFIFSSEIKALLPFLPHAETNHDALSEYLTFQYTLGEQTLFAGVEKLMPGHFLIIENGRVEVRKYWDVEYKIDYDHTAAYFENKLQEIMQNSVSQHTVSDVPIGSYLSGGVDSSLVTALAANSSQNFHGSFHGKFTDHPGYDESEYAQVSANGLGKPLFVADITSQDFTDNIQKIIYHLDTPTAGPGSFPQYMVSELASQHVKVVLGGQGGDEIFGGYARYVIAYFEQAMKAAIDGTYKNGNFVVTPESIIPNLTLLKEYKPLLKKFWQEGLFEPIDDRYFRLIDRSVDMQGEINWNMFDKSILLEKFRSIFNNQDNVRKEAYFDKMTHFDFKCLLPALLHVEDRMSMAHGIESRVPFLDHELVEFAATIPADIKFPGGKMKNLLKESFKAQIPDKILNRRDKMGFPVPLKEWFSGPLKEFVYDVFSSEKAKTRGFYDPKMVLQSLNENGQYSRKVWGLLSLELWHQTFHDKHVQFKQLKEEVVL